LVERFRHVLKSGTCIGELQLKKAGCLQKAVVLYSLAAFRIMQLVYESRSHPEASCEVVLTKEEWMVLWMLTSHGAPLPAEPPGLAEAVKSIARLGGHPGRKGDGPSGVKTTWLGYQRIQDAANFEQLINQNLGNG
jgi:hypothetical protein